MTPSHRVGTLPAGRDQGRAGCCAAASSSSAPRALSSALASSLQSARRPSSSSRRHAQWSTPLFPRHTIVRALADALQRLDRRPICISRAFPPRREGPPPTEYPSRRHNTDFPPPPHASHPPHHRHHLLPRSPYALQPLARRPIASAAPSPSHRGGKGIPPTEDLSRGHSTDFSPHPRTLPAT